MSDNDTKMTEPISKEEMIDILKGLVFGTFDRTTAKEREALVMAIKLFEQEPKTGHWIAVENEEMEVVGYYCSECDLPMETEQRINFCPNCGTKMVESQKSEE